MVYSRDKSFDQILNTFCTALIFKSLVFGPDKLHYFLNDFKFKYLIYFKYHLIDIMRFKAI